MTSAAPPVRQLPSLTGYRSLLFVAVFLTHALGAGMFFANEAVNWAGTILPYGTAALATFFVLSGFVLTWGEPWRTPVRRFWRRRAVKIWPGHIVAWAFTLFLLFALGPTTMLGSLDANGPGQILANLFLVQAWIPEESYLFSVYGVNWSVSNEVLFYLLLPLLIKPILKIRDNRLWYWFAAVVAAIVAVPVITHFFVGGEPWGGGDMSFAQVYYTNFFPLARLPEFLLGVFLARIVQTGRWPSINGWWYALLSLILCALMVVLPGTFRISGLLTIGICFFVPVLAARDLSGRSSWMNNKVMVFFGNTSYAAYLVHFPLLGLTRWMVGENNTFGFFTGTLIVVVLFIVTQAAGAALFLGVEQPLMRRFANPRRSRPGTGARVPGPQADPDTERPSPAGLQESR
ncbi:putative acyltransferase [Actinoplanes missouriensis 431]|uniref:Putative acyltransferase n=1 Tax=Actinoplanes missouriensis (strain ATCC 14538 / DSM 43046 / CBS 188.64 / JCM 3121 / NBRC 102363 / NCIMB 12654 / NRRL B-3342 / UNCC 431) TaxID=512565 RepID=I0HB87_ACTM4|nr:acyltransferase [Actinoplanes missouriensis]BAL90274.1 putative acyltransferase [Actinoplanes missouriensis 431]